MFYLFHFSDWEKNGVGKVFDYYGRVPEAEYQPQMDLRHLERAVLHNDDALFEKAVAVSQKSEGWSFIIL